MHAGRGSNRRLCAAVAGLTLLLWGDRADAEVPPSGLRTRLEYSAPASCPDEGRFRELLAQHSAVVIDDSAPIVLRVEVSRDRKRHRGRVALLRHEEEGAREVVADRCEDVVRGLALFSAIALDAWFERPPREDERPRAQVPSEVRPPPPASKPTRMAPPEERAPARREALQPRFWFGAGLGQHGATTTRMVRHLGVVGELELPWTLRSTLRVTAGVGAVVPERYRDGTLTFVMGWGRLDVCPAWLDLGRARVSVCPAGELGVQRAALDSAAVGRSDVRPWAAVGALARIRAGIGRGLDLGVSAGVLAPLLPFDFRTRTGIAYSIATLAPVVELDLVTAQF